MRRAGTNRRRAPIAILTDFGYRDHYVGAMKGVIATIAPQAPVIDITHGIPAQSIIAGAIALRECWRYFPAETIFLSVVDPGVGTARLPIAVETLAGACFVAPDNGLVWLAIEQAGLKRAVELRAQRYRLPKVSSTFHGRDIFAPAAAHLWRGEPLDAMGPRLRTIERLSIGEPVVRGRRLVGMVIYVDGFGNLVTNIGREALARFTSGFPGARVSVRIGRGAPLRIVNAYGDAPIGTPLATFGSFELLEIAVREASAAQFFKASEGTPITVTVNPGLRNG
jgi:S-adenosylmethionine hydrolase